MYKSKIFFALLITLAFFTSDLFCQSIKTETIDNTIKISFSSPVDSLNTVRSNWFAVPEYLSHSLSTYPVNYTKIQNSASAKPYITVMIEGSNDQVNVAVVDTIGGSLDSLETLYSGTANLNEKKFWYYRIVYKGESKSATLKNRKDATLRTDLLFIRPKD